MAYVFGIEGVPVFEMLFILFVLMLAGLILILYEVRRLRKLIKEEKLDINRLEKDLDLLEQDEGKKYSARLREYIHHYLNRGLSIQQIEESLMKKGWKRKVIDKLLNEVKPDLNIQGINKQ